jgi:hypothetical protein
MLPNVLRHLRLAGAVRRRYALANPVSGANQLKVR